MEYIKNLADNIIKKYNTRDPFRIISESGINLIFNYEMENLKGFYSVVKEKSYIVINGNLEGSTKRIVASHELGHNFLHGDLAKDNVISELTLFDTENKIEYEANIFASELLISDEDVLKAGEYFETYSKIAKALSEDENLLKIKVRSMINRGFKLNFPNNIKSDFLK